MLIHKLQAFARSLWINIPRYLVLLFLVWKQYWNMVASTLFLFILFSIGTELILRLASAFSICSLPKYFQNDFTFLSLTFTFHCSMLRVGIAVITSDVSLSVTSRVLSSIKLSSNRPGLPCIPLDTSSKPSLSSAASLRLSSLWYAPSAYATSILLPVTSSIFLIASSSYQLSGVDAPFTCISVIRLGLPSSSVVSVKLALYPLTTLPPLLRYCASGSLGF